MPLEPETSISDNPPLQWDIFSAVIDNYGDIGVCWRLARQLAEERQFDVRLWTDSLTSFQKICPEVNLLLPVQRIRGVEIRLWAEPLPQVRPADIVVEAFGCKLPAPFIELMAQGRRHHVWINLEYLSAEEWVDSHHGLVSPHPQLPLVKHFFFPGFSTSTGGLLVEKGLAAQRDTFQANPQEQARFWTELGLPVPENDEMRISLFSYENHSVSRLFSGWVEAEAPVVCIVPEGVAEKQIKAFFKLPGATLGSAYRKGALTVRVLPFLAQEIYDKLLWACDFNFVRGEDSFVRAQLAARPMAWQIYPQEGGAHWPKLDAFLARYCAALPQPAANMLRRFMQKWNQSDAEGSDWKALWAHRAILHKHARDWAASLLEKEDLATNLIKFCKNKLK